MKLPTNHTLHFQIGQTVYLKTDEDQLPRLVTSIILKPNNGVTYILVCGPEETEHFNIEISDERGIVF